MTGNPSARRCQAHVNLVEMQQMTAEVGTYDDGPEIHTKIWEIQCLFIGFYGFYRVNMGYTNGVS
jgi:hypothetical protein